MKLFVLAIVMSLCAGCSTSLGTGGWQVGFGTGAQQCEQGMTCKLDCQRQVTND
jgi:hypothetical protein